MRLKRKDWRYPYPFGDGSQRVFYRPNICFFGSSPENVTSTTSNSPWTAQQPYLTSGFSQAADLLNQPAPTQQNPVAPFNSTENSALSGITSTAANGTPIIGAAGNFATNLENGSYLNSNPGNGYFSSLAGSNLGLNNPGATTLQGFTNGTGAGESTLQGYANGDQLSGPDSTATANTILSQVVPQVASEFNNGNNANNPGAAYAASAGATSALAPIEYQNYQTQEQLQQQAANTLSSNALSGANSLETGALSGGQLENSAATGLSGNYNSGITSMVQGNALAPADASLPYTNYNEMLGAGATEQQQEQAQESGQAATANYAALSPYQQLAAYMGDVTGGVTGNSGTSTTPYFTNNASNILGGLTGGAGILGTLGNAATAAPAAGSTAAGLKSLASFI